MNAPQQESARTPGVEDQPSGQYRWNTKRGWRVVAAVCLIGSLISLSWGLTQWHQHVQEAAVVRIQAGDLQTTRTTPLTRLLVDVRPPVAYTQSHIAGAISLPEADLAQWIGRLPATGQVILYCA